eukprot:9480309-Pyramimonas_sp.AAC.1
MWCTCQGASLRHPKVPSRTLLWEARSPKAPVRSFPEQPAGTHASVVHIRKIRHRAPWHV